MIIWAFNAVSTPRPLKCNVKEASSIRGKCSLRPPPVRVSAKEISKKQGASKARRHGQAHPAKGPGYRAWRRRAPGKKGVLICECLAIRPTPAPRDQTRSTPRPWRAVKPWRTFRRRVVRWGHGGALPAPALAHRLLGLRVGLGRKRCIRATFMFLGRARQLSRAVRGWALYHRPSQSLPIWRPVHHNFA